MTHRPCRPWLTYRGQPRRYQPWCECGWRGNTWCLSPNEAQRIINRHVGFTSRHWTQRIAA